MSRIVPQEPTKVSRGALVELALALEHHKDDFVFAEDSLFLDSRLHKNTMALSIPTWPDSDLYEVNVKE